MGRSAVGKPPSPTRSKYCSALRNSGQGVAAAAAGTPLATRIGSGAAAFQPPPAGAATCSRRPSGRLKVARPTAAGMPPLHGSRADRCGAGIARPVPVAGGPRRPGSGPGFQRVSRGGVDQHRRHAAGTALQVHSPTTSASHPGSSTWSPTPRNWTICRKIPIRRVSSRRVTGGSVLWSTLKASTLRPRPTNRH